MKKLTAMVITCCVLLVVAASIAVAAGWTARIQFVVENGAGSWTNNLAAGQNVELEACVFSCLPGTTNDVVMNLLTIGSRGTATNNFLTETNVAVSASAQTDFEVKSADIINITATDTNRHIVTLSLKTE